MAELRGRDAYGRGPDGAATSGGRDDGGAFAPAFDEEVQGGQHQHRQRLRSDQAPEDDDRFEGPDDDYFDEPEMADREADRWERAFWGD